MLQSPTTYLLQPTTSLARFDVIADDHVAPHRDDSRRCGVALRGQNSDLADDLSRLSRLRTIAIDREEIAGLQLIVAAKVDLQQLAHADDHLEALRLND